MSELTFQTATGPISVSIDNLIVAGWTGRDEAAVQHHIDELAELGVKPPSQVPLYYRVGADLLTQANQIAVVGAASSGEVEPFILCDAAGSLWLGLASDHTDRELESVSVAKSKQICPKPVAPVLWRFEHVQSHLDRLRLQSQILQGESDDWTDYQTGAVSAIRPLEDLMRGLPGGHLAPGTAMLCGTFPALGGIRPSRAFRMRLEDPVTGNMISHSYSIKELPIIT